MIESEMPTEAEESMMAVLNVPSPGAQRARAGPIRTGAGPAWLTSQGAYWQMTHWTGQTGLAMLAPPGSAGGVAPPSSPQDSPAGRVRHAGTPSAHLSGFHQAPAKIQITALLGHGAQLLSNASESRLWKVSVPCLTMWQVQART